MELDENGKLKLTRSPNRAQAFPQGPAPALQIPGAPAPARSQQGLNRGEFSGPAPQLGLPKLPGNTGTPASGLESIRQGGGTPTSVVPGQSPVVPVQAPVTRGQPSLNRGEFSGPTPQLGSGNIGAPSLDITPEGGYAAGAGRFIGSGDKFVKDAAGVAKRGAISLGGTLGGIGDRFMEGYREANPSSVSAPPPADASPVSDSLRTAATGLTGSNVNLTVPPTPTPTPAPAPTPPQTPATSAPSVQNIPSTPGAQGVPTIGSAPQAKQSSASEYPDVNVIRGVTQSVARYNGDGQYVEGAPRLSRFEQQQVRDATPGSAKAKASAVALAELQRQDSAVAESVAAAQKIDQEGVIAALVADKDNRARLTEQDRELADRAATNEAERRSKVHKVAVPVYNPDDGKPVLDLDGAPVTRQALFRENVDTGRYERIEIESSAQKNDAPDADTPANRKTFREKVEKRYPNADKASIDDTVNAHFTKS